MVGQSAGDFFGISLGLLYLFLAFCAFLVAIAPLACWIHLSRLNAKADKLVAACEKLANQQPTAHQIETAVTNAIRDNAPSPLDEKKTLVAEPGPAFGDRIIVCNLCQRKIRIAANSQFKPGDRAKCPGCQAAFLTSRTLASKRQARRLLPGSH